MTFHNQPRASHDVMHHVHDSPMVMLVPLFVLAAGAGFSGFFWLEGFVGIEMEHFWGEAIHFAATNEVPHHAHDVPMWVKLLPLAAGIFGILFATYAYLVQKGLPGFFAGAFSPLYLLSYNKWYFDEIYDFLLVKPALKLGRFLWLDGDGKTIDGVGPDGIASTVAASARRIVKVQSGYMYHYAFIMLVGIAALVTFIVVRMGGVR